MKKRLLGLLLATVIACGSLTACGTSQETISKGTTEKTISRDTSEEIVSEDNSEEIILGDTTEEIMSAFADYYDEFLDRHYDDDPNASDMDCIGRVAYFDNQPMMIIADSVFIYEGGATYDIYILAYEKGEVVEKYYLKGLRSFGGNEIFCHACGKGLHLGFGKPVPDYCVIDGEDGDLYSYLNENVNYYFSDGEVKAYIFSGYESFPDFFHSIVDDDALDYIAAQGVKAYIYRLGDDGTYYVYDANSEEKVGTLDTVMPPCICESKFGYKYSYDESGFMDMDSYWDSYYDNPYIILVGMDTYNSDKLYHGTLTGTDFLRYLDRLAEEKSINSEDEIKKVYFEFMGVNEDDFTEVQNIDEEVLKEGRKRKLKGIKAAVEYEQEWKREKKSESESVSDTEW